MKMDIQDCFSVVYIVGWIVIGIGVFIVAKAAWFNHSDDIGLGVLFGGLYMTSFVANAQLKVRIIELERELGKR